MHILEHEPMNKYHTKLFRLLFDDGFADEFMREPPCMLDRLAESFRRLYPAPEAATSAEAKATFEALACVLKIDVGLLECRFSFR